MQIAQNILGWHYWHILTLWGAGAGIVIRAKNSSWQASKEDKAISWIYIDWCVRGRKSPFKVEWPVMATVEKTSTQGQLDYLSCKAKLVKQQTFPRIAMQTGYNLCIPLISCVSTVSRNEKLPHSAQCEDWIVRGEQFLHIGYFTVWMPCYVSHSTLRSSRV